MKRIVRVVIGAGALSYVGPGRGVPELLIAFGTDRATADNVGTVAFLVGWVPLIFLALSVLRAMASDERRE